MTEPDEFEFDAWQEDVAFLAKTLAELFESEKSRYHIDDINNTLFVEIEGLEEYSEDEISGIAEPLLEELDLDFEDIILMPLSVK